MPIRRRNKKTLWRTGTFGAGILFAAAVAWAVWPKQADDEVDLRPVVRTNGPNVRVEGNGASDFELKPIVRTATNSFQSGASSGSAGILGAFAERVFQAQLGLIRKGISPGSIDGLMGSQTRA